MSSGLRCQLVLFVASFASLGSSSIWHSVNVGEVNCPGGNGSTKIVMDFPPSASNDTFYVLTIFRTSQEAAELDFTVTDAAGKRIADEKVTLARLAADRRLQEVASRQPDAVAASSESEELGRWLDGLADVERRQEPEEAPEEFEVAMPPGRQLGFRRGGSGSSRRRAPSPPAAYYSPRRRTVSPMPAPYSSPRRRGMAPMPSPSMSSPRRRVGGFSSGYRRRYSSSHVGGVSKPGYGYSNPVAGGAGRYGYSNQQSLYNNYGGHAPMQTKYGYSGANAITGGSGAKVAMALGGGLLAGAAGGYLLSHLAGHIHNPLAGIGDSISGMFDPYKLNCKSGSVWTGLCGTCVQLFPASKCEAEFTPAVNISRDDLMTSGFLAANFVSPITVDMTRIAGSDFGANVVCPPAGWSAADAAAQEQSGNASNASNHSVWAPGLHSSLWLTLTEVPRATETTPPEVESPNTAMHAIAAAMWSLCACCLCCCGAACVFLACRRGKEMGDTSSSYTDSDSSSYEHAGPGPFGQQAAYGGFPGQAPYGYQQPPGPCGYQQPPGPYGYQQPPDPYGYQPQDYPQPGMEMQAMQHDFGQPTGYQPGAPTAGYVPGRPI